MVTGDVADGAGTEGGTGPGQDGASGSEGAEAAPVSPIGDHESGLARPVRLPLRLAAAVAVIASASLWIYLTHWQVYPGLEAAGHPVLAILASLAVGVLCQRAVGRVGRPVRAALRQGQRRPRPTPGRPPRSCASAASPR